MYTGVNVVSKLNNTIETLEVQQMLLHNTGATVTNHSSFSGWGQSSADTDTVTDPGLWSLDNLGTTLIALIHNGECFKWDADLTILKPE